ncbi:hypothetical protein GQX74_006513 [Glossina fuscipes]|nr:hypothetical protein GQX74_006513 [Glossina fuscipes]
MVRDGVNKPSITDFVDELKSRPDDEFASSWRCLCNVSAKPSDRRFSMPDCDEFKRIASAAAIVSKGLNFNPEEFLLNLRAITGELLLDEDEFRLRSVTLELGTNVDVLALFISTDITTEFAICMGCICAYVSEPLDNLFSDSPCDAVEVLRSPWDSLELTIVTTITSSGFFNFTIPSRPIKSFLEMEKKRKKKRDVMGEMLNRFLTKYIIFIIVVTFIVKF